MSRDKKVLICEAALSLVYENNDLSAIKVADIARRANIGKGTVYEYFHSKEQVIGEALIYRIQQGLQRFARLLDEGLSFKETYLAFLRHYKAMISKNRHIYNLMTMNPAHVAVHAAVHAVIYPRLRQLKDQYFQLMERLVARSVEEGIIKPDPDRFDWQTAVLSSITGIFLHQQFPADFPHLGDEEVLEKAYSVYVKLLS